MLSFEISAIDLILAVAVIILLIIYLTKSAEKPSTDEKLLFKNENTSRKPATEATTLKPGQEKPMSP